MPTSTPIPTSMPAPTSTPVLVARTVTADSSFFLRLEDARELTQMVRTDDSRYFAWKSELQGQGRVLTLPRGTVIMIGRDIAPEISSHGTQHFYEAALKDGTRGYIANTPSIGP